ncbi:biotin/lipoyl-containing protein [Nonomuraea sp. NPDC052634]|jgi:acetyl-CoA carboxylase biotin carboxyl carrier protein|uniref:acetyl-CoA carboxylase biotin carboxyl carrier protein n=1 Tax=Nonomuraea sp. NPDC052634 TaxID=3155813 RepID=UPI003437EC78
MRELLGAAQAGVLDLLNGLSRQPRTLRLAVGPVTIELDWSEGQAPAAPPPAAALPTAPAQAGHASQVEPAGQSTPPEEETVTLAAPSVGVFYRAPEPGAPPFVAEGDTVVPGQKVGLIEAMKLMIPVEADRKGRIAACLQPDGMAVEYGQPLFAVVPDEGG